jgi:riboflavin biosynthesis pyrimidine reductase
MSAPVSGHSHLRRDTRCGCSQQSRRIAPGAVLAAPSDIVDPPPEYISVPACVYMLMDVNDTDAFQRFSADKAREATIASIERLSTTFDRRDDLGLQGIGNAWSRLHYGGEFGLVRPNRNETAVSLVFVQTKDGNTGGPNPNAFGGGATDTHLIYEGLSRVAADAVLAGARSVHRDAFFSVWHAELVALRASLGLPRHPAQIVVSKRGRVDVDALLFNVPDVPVFLIAGDECLARHEPALRARSWVRLIPVNGDDVRFAVERLRVQEGIQRVSAIGGRFTATQLVDAGWIQDIYLTTSSLEGGAPGTPWYCGPTHHSSRPSPASSGTKGDHESSLNTA